MKVNGKEMVDVTEFIAGDYDRIQTAALVRYARKNHPELINRSGGCPTISVANLAKIEKEYKGTAVLFKAI